MQAHTLDEPDWKSLARRKLEHFEEEIHTGSKGSRKNYFIEAVGGSTSILQALAKKVDIHFTTPENPENMQKKSQKKTLFVPMSAKFKVGGGVGLRFTAMSAKVLFFTLSPVAFDIHDRF